MSVLHSTGSPASRRTTAAKMAQTDENVKLGKEDFSINNASEQLKSLLIFETDAMDALPSQKRVTSALSTSSLVNQSCPEKTKLNHEQFSPSETAQSGLANSNPSGPAQQSSGPPVTGNALKYSLEPVEGQTAEHARARNSMPVTPATENIGNAAPITRPASATVNQTAVSEEEVMRLKLQLAHAQSQIIRLEGLASTRQSRMGLDQSTSTSPVDVNFPGLNHSVPTKSRIPGLNPVTAGPHYMGREGGRPWSGYDNNRSDTSDGLSATGFTRPRNIWGGMKQMPTALAPGGIPPLDMPPNGTWVGRAASHSYVDSGHLYGHAATGNFRPERLTPDFDLTTKPPGTKRGSRFDNRFGPQGYGNAGQGYNDQSVYGGYPYAQGQFDTRAIQPGPHHGLGTGYPNYQPTPVSTTLSPLATEFTSLSTGTGPWKSEPAQAEGQTFLPTTEPLNYRRLLDRTANCNWKYIVDKIVCSNDQQASIFLQQKLKVGTPDQKYDIVEAIVAQAYPLMVNRFGNFLVQRCFEHGTPEQVIKIAEAIRGATLTLSMDPFGCHVVQKAFDSVPEDYKAIMVHELLCRIPDTVVHRYACHVWQKLFELRWTKSPPQIMKYVNEALSNMWHEVALGETGSLVVQNIFENCLEEDKRPCIEEVLNNIDIVAHGQFGNWCIQHICEHGAPADRSRAIDHVIRYAAEYSMDQYASKVVEKCLKIGGPEFLARYLDRVCEGRIDRPRIPLIDIASDQYGNYLIQWILQHATPQHKDIVAAHIRKHMVSLRGSKFGSRVGMLCTNPALATRPGPGASSGVSRMPAGPRYGGRPYQ
ncbi:armadillo-type protein [Xylaria sp. CBS 124048]|nr:armadillo-type protein [Xylaria sp. CBS 124048]